jgi:hypothetical protein
MGAGSTCSSFSGMGNGDPNVRNTRLLVVPDTEEVSPTMHSHLTAPTYVRPAERYQTIVEASNVKPGSCSSSAAK